MNQHKARWEQGLEDLFADIRNWAYGRKEPQQSPETMTQSKENPMVVNNVYNYTNEARTPLKTVRFGFITIGKIILLTVLIGLTIKVLLDPMILINGINTLKEVLHSI